MKVIFMGTPAFAVPSLLALSEHHQVLAVITQPDKPKGRGKKMLCSEVKEEALKLGLPVLQPQNAKDPAFLEELKQYDAELFVVAAYGQILTEDVLFLPKYGSINVHGSLLPKYRGAGPIQWSIINGEAQTGVTIMQMERGLDSGDMLLKEALPITETDTYGTLTEKMANLGASLLLKTMDAIQNGTVKPEKQVDEESTYAPMIAKSMGHLDWSKPAKELHQLIRGLNPQPAAYTMLEEAPLKVLAAEVCAEESGQAPGTVVGSDKKGLLVQTGTSILRLTQVQAQGKKAMDAAAFLRGHAVPEGTVLQ